VDIAHADRYIVKQKKMAGLLRDEIETLISTVRGTSGLGNLVKEPLAKTRRGLNARIGNDRPWPLLPLIVSEAICNKYEQTLPAAASLQFFLAAGDVFDDIEDADSQVSIYAKHGLAIATNVASTLLILGECSLTRLKLREVDADTIVHTIDVVNTFYTKACAGQHLDLIEEVQLLESEEMYLNIIAMKSAGQIECACHVGALIAGANQELIDSFALFGSNLGIASQISNDIQGMIRGRDIEKRKITLPIIYALNLPDNNVHDKLKSAFQKQSSPPKDFELIKKLLFRTGAIHYATLKMDVYRQKALDALSRIQLYGVDIARLKLFVV
jgi:octaprenyl-diphosphate synthase